MYCDINVAIRIAMKQKSVYYKRTLPHIHPTDGIFFITFRLAGSLPGYVIRNLQKERERQIIKLRLNQNRKALKEARYYINLRFFKKYDEILDGKKSGPVWLKENLIAKAVAQCLHNYDRIRYDLYAYCIMPNHVHIVISSIGYDYSQIIDHAGKTNNYPVTDCLRLLKGSTARKCNQILQRTGAFWHHESYDHYVRNEKELFNIIEYMHNNPVKAGLVNDPEEWKHFFMNKEIQL